MTVGLRVNHYWYPIGTGDFLHSFFSTISYHLEPDGWGSKYPVLIKKLYHENMERDSIPALLDELKEIHEKLRHYAPSQVVWDIDDLTKQPPRGNQISPEITDLSNYFVSSGGVDVFKIFFTAIEDALEGQGYDLKIASL